MASPSVNLQKAYPEMAAGGFSRVDGTIEFYTRLNALLDPSMRVLDIGAGRGAQLLSPAAPFKSALAKVQGKVQRLVGADIDPAVLGHPFLDEAHVIHANSPLPFDDSAFDLVYADWVLEHVHRPEPFAQEILRVLRPGGWFCARTPNRWGMTGVAARLVPNRLHSRLLRHLQPDRQEHDVFPTAYRLNTRRQVRRYFGMPDWEDFSYLHNPEPPYVQRSKLLIAIAKLFFRLAPESLATNLHIFARKKPNAS
ncbi:MAG TPA: class I SAM-dependent methyltransferase [Sphingomicrobium sp.]|nr:class I SAM-dependent methyltransferase [Sphingomicrobium sp.]